MQQAISVEQITDKAGLLNSVQRQTVYEFIDFLLNKNYLNGHKNQEKPATQLKDTEDDGPETSVLRSVSISTLKPLIGIIAIGGDAFEESEALYDD